MKETIDVFWALKNGLSGHICSGVVAVDAGLCDSEITLAVTGKILENLEVFIPLRDPKTIAAHRGK